jgi:hypothetical protein
MISDQLTCICGRGLSVPESVAGFSITCICGKVVEVPAANKPQREAITTVVPLVPEAAVSLLAETRSSFTGEFAARPSAGWL